MPTTWPTSARSNSKDLGDKIPAEKKTGNRGSVIAGVRKALEGTDTDAIKTAQETLQTKFQEVSADLYRHAAETAQAQQPGAGGAAPGGGAQAQPDDGGTTSPHGDVVDAEFEMVDEDKKPK